MRCNFAQMEYLLQYLFLEFMKKIKKKEKDNVPESEISELMIQSVTFLVTICNCTKAIETIFINSLRNETFDLHRAFLKVYSSNKSLLF